jgi:hypothetical protein
LAGKLSPVISGVRPKILSSALHLNICSSITIIFFKISYNFMPVLLLIPQ